ncbi:Radical SAM superfamily protein [Planctomycetes bacterium Poly30]|uniref:Radical SAM superfamily protein n=1 Tax=Saltatorellus ferox TaxID=2528018 RepID=A0A518EQF6_9BACT|nr:Radical SAM superfamily protein [Planctomycetes bacterium Poly30]
MAQDVQDKLKILADAAKYDASCASSGVKRSNGGKGVGNATGSGICHSYTPDGRCVSLLKILLTNRCIYDCRYCVNRVSNDVPRAAFTVEEVVRLTIEFYRRNYIEGLFLSSGVTMSSDRTMDLLAEVARKLREEEDFHGYIHLKGVVGASTEALEKAGRYADRVSANIELPLQSDLDRLAPEKSIDEAEGAMRFLKEGIDESRARASRPSIQSTNSGPRRQSRPPRRFAPAGQSTQMIVGATPSSDSSVLSTADRLYRSHGLRRVYYTAYSPIPNAHQDLPLEPRVTDFVGGSPPALVREHRLYQADWLLRFYGFTIDEVVTRGDGNLELEIDPKMAWALAHREFFPVDVNRAPREALLRVPGLGTRSVEKILKARARRRLREVDLRQLRAPIRRVMPFIVAADTWEVAARSLDGEGLAGDVRKDGQQLLLFEAAASARSGQV